MKKRILTAAGLICAATVLAAFAPPMTASVAGAQQNVTVIYKSNPNWPVRGLMTTDPCEFRTCHNI
jgi:hypothetical protein